MSSRILITGGTGLLGVNWAVAMRARHQVVLATHSRSVHLSGVACAQIDLESESALDRAMDTFNPDCVVHAAGLTSVEYCEEHPELAHTVNVVLAENVAKACARSGAALIHISSDHLFSGDTPSVSEETQPSPQNVYAQTKAEAEQRVLAANANALVVRTNFYGWGPFYRKSFSDWVIESLENGKKITLFDDVFYSPIYAGRLVSGAHALLGSGATGIYNVVGNDRLSKLDFGLKVAAKFGLNRDLIQVGRISDTPSLVRRPHDMSLSNRKASARLGMDLGGSEEHLNELKTGRAASREFQKL
jgi:dTDP-4-dehydrorhamnose reductase